MVVDDSTLHQLAERYADTVVRTPFHPPVKKADAREFAVNAWLAGFKKAVLEGEKDNDG